VKFIFSEAAEGRRAGLIADVSKRSENFKCMKNYYQVHIELNVSHFSLHLST